MRLNKQIMTILALMLSVAFGLSVSPVLAQSTDPIKDALAGCGVITFDSDAQGFRTASTRENRTVNSGPFNAPYSSGSNRFQWEAAGGNPSGHVRADDLDGEYQEVWTPVLTDSDFSALNGQQLQFDYRNDTGYNQYRLYIAIVGNNGQQYYYYFNGQLGSPGTWSRVKVPMVASAWHTGFEAIENPSTPPDSPAPSTANFAAVLSNLSRIAISVEGVQGSDISRFDNFGRACDWGDLPESGTSFVTIGANAARHNISDTIRLGALIDTEPTGQPTTAADGDDANFSDDEDGLANIPLLPIATANYSLPVAVTNTTGNNGTLYGWIDLNGDGRLEPAEVQTATVPGNGSVTSVTLTWPNVRVATGATLYARLRFTTFPLNDDTNTPADERAQGIASDGEVEDYLLSAAPLGSLKVIKNAVGGNDSFSFNTTGLSPTSFTLTTVGGTAQRTFANLLPGNYSVTELLSPAWNLTGATCTGGKDPAGFFLALSENVTCTFTNQPPSYSVGATVSGGYGGTVSCTPASVTRGGSSSCTAVPDPDFRVLTWGGDCAAAGSNVQCALTNILADKSSTVSFTLIPPATYNVTAIVAGGSYGSVGCYPGNVRAGESSTCIAVAFTGFRVKDWGGACAAAGSDVQCMLTNIQADQASTVSFELTPPATYNVTATVVGGSYGGSVGCFPGNVKVGESSTCIAVPKSGFRVLHWGGACAAAGSNSTCSLNKIQAYQVSTVSFELTPPATYTVTATVVGGNGSVGCFPNSMKAGESSTCIAVPYAGFQVQSWGGACAAAGSNVQCDLTNIQADQNSTVSFAAQPVPNFTVSATVSGGNGTVNCAPSPVPQGDSSSCTAAPDPGYQVAGWTGDCAASGQNVHCALSNIQRDQSSTVSFVVIPPNSYTVTATVALGHGSVSCTPNTVTAGGSSACTAVPEAGYQVHDWSGDCAATGSLAQCNLTNILANQTSTVSFTPQLPNTDTFTVNATVTGGNGTVSCDPTRVVKGGQSACTAVPATGYQVQAWSGDCATAGSDAHCYLPKIQKDQTSTVSFAAVPAGAVHVFALVAGGNGTVSCAPASVPVGGSVTCTAAPEAGYRVDHWDGACLLAGNSPQCRLANLQSDQSSTVRFMAAAPNTFSVSATVSGGNGTVSCTPASVPAGGSSTCTALPSAGFQVQSWSGACASTGTNTQCTLTNIQSDVSSTVRFAALPPPITCPYGLIPDTDGDGVPDVTEIAQGTDPQVKDNDVFTQPDAFVAQLYRDLLYREPEATGLTYWQAQLQAGLSRGEVIDAFYTFPEFQNGVGAIARLYHAAFNRTADPCGLAFWVEQWQGGRPLTDIAAFFVVSGEFLDLGVTDPVDFVTRLYENVLGRQPDVAGLDFWLDQIAQGATWGEILLDFTQSPEYRAALDHPVTVDLYYLGFLHREPDAVGYAAWLNELDQAVDPAPVHEAVQATPEYQDRVLGAPTGTP